MTDATRSQARPESDARGLDNIRVAGVQTPAKSGPMIIVLPIYCVCLGSWAVIGFLFWIPLLVRATASVGVAVLSSALSDDDPARVTIAFERAASFYARGFRLIHEVLFPQTTRWVVPKEQDRSPYWTRLALDTAWTVVFWGSFALMGYRMFAPEPAMASIRAHVSDARLAEVDAGDAFAFDFPKQQFDSTAARYIGLKISFQHPPIEEDVVIPVSCHYAGPSQEIASFLMKENYVASRGDKSGAVVLNSGFRNPGRWPKGDYVAECSSEDRIFLRSRFSVN
jgi:hypothetical protein